MERKKPRIADVARLAGVSNATVSRAMNNRELVNAETYRRIAQAMNVLGFVEKQSAPREPACRDIIVLSVPTMENPFYNGIARGAQSAAERFGCSVLIYNNPLDESGLQKLIELVRRETVLGLITLNNLSLEALDRLRSVTAVVQCTEYCEDANVSYVSIDDYQAARTALDYLYARGRRRIAFVNGPLKNKYARQRQKSYLDFLAEHELPVKDEWNIQLPEIDFSMAVASIRQILGKPNPPDAVFTASDILASAAIKVAKKYGMQVPRDLMVVGFDNIDISSMSDPTITTINQPRREMGYMACEILVEQATHAQREVKQILLETELIVRESTMD